jgi:hypothetical protein
MTPVLVAFLLGVAIGAYLHYRKVGAQAEQDYYDEYHRHDIDHLLTERDTARNVAGRALALARKTRRRVTS